MYCRRILVELFCTVNVFLFLVSACDDKKAGSGNDLFERFPVVAEKVLLSQGDTVIVCDFSKLKDTLDLPLSILLSDFKIVDLEEENADAIVGEGNIFATENYTGIYTFGASGGYKLFDINGKYICQVSSRGQGPQEYIIGIYDSYIDETDNMIYLLSWNSRYIMVFDLQGNFRKNIPLSYEITKGRFRIDTKKQQITVATLPFQNAKSPSIIWTQDFEGNIIMETSIGHFEIKPDYSNEIYAFQNVDAMDLSFSYWVPKNDTLYHYDTGLKPVFTVRFNENNIKAHEYNELPGYYIMQIYGDKEENAKIAMIDKKTLRGGYVRIKLDMLGNIPGQGWLLTNRGYYTANMSPYELKEQLETALLSPNLDEKMKETMHKFKAHIREDDDNNYFFIGKLKQEGEISLQEKIKNGEITVTVPNIQSKEETEKSKDNTPESTLKSNENASNDNEDNRVYRGNEDMKYIRTTPFFSTANEYFRKNNKYVDWDIKDKKNVLIRAVAEKNGTLSNVEVAKSSDIKELDNEAVRLMKEAVIDPAISYKNKPVRCEFVIIVFFPPLAEGETPSSRGR